jgi:hypothetical protein
MKAELIGKIINSWKIISFCETVNRVRYYNCICLECGIAKKVSGSNIKTGGSKRCLDCSHKDRILRQTGKAVCKEPAQSIAERYLFNTKRKDAKKRGQVWELSREHFLDIIYANCNYCGTAPRKTVNPTKGHNLAPSRAKECFITYNGIDRVDSNIGYTLENTVTCCTICNRAKSDLTLEEFFKWVKNINFFINGRKTS